jgi:hypothetical protein
MSQNNQPNGLIKESLALLKGASRFGRLFPIITSYHNWNQNVQSP